MAAVAVISTRPVILQGGGHLDRMAHLLMDMGYHCQIEVSGPGALTSERLVVYRKAGAAVRFVLWVNEQFVTSGVVHCDVETRYFTEVIRVINRYVGGALTRIPWATFFPDRRGDGRR